ncbi:DUF933 domain-containing protein [archaeon]|nr:MAG: DUF933 domain-containing protein [archaeon]
MHVCLCMVYVFPCTLVAYLFIGISLNAVSSMWNVGHVCICSIHVHIHSFPYAYPPYYVCRNFIRADVVSFEDFQALGGDRIKLAIEGKVRAQGRKYIVNDGEIVDFVFHI